MNSIFSWVVVICSVAYATAYYGGGYGDDSVYSYDYEQPMNGYERSGYSNLYDDYDVGYDDEDIEEPVYGGGNGVAYGSPAAYDTMSSAYSAPSSYSSSSSSSSRGRGRSSRRSRGGRRGYSRRNQYADDEAGYDKYDDYEDYEEEDEYAPRRRYSSGRRRGSRMDRYGRSGTYGYAKPKKHVPVIIKKKKEKKKKIISTHSGFYIPGGTAIFGKFKDLKSCQKACELTPTCFSGDYNPWLNKCYIHSNLTACMSLKAHKQITHFKKVPCNIVETPRGLITLGAASWNGLQQKNVNSLMDCIKKCATAGGGVAPTPETAADTPQLCFGIDYDFADHTCYFHTLIAICGGNADASATPLTPVSLYANPSSINILICPLTT